MTTKHGVQPVTSSTNSSASSTRQAAQILYRMANSSSAGTTTTAAAVATTSGGSTLITEPITPVLVAAGPTVSGLSVFSDSSAAGPLLIWMIFMTVGKSFSVFIR